MSITEIPLIASNPVKFLKDLSYGSGFVLAGIAFYIGPLNYINGLFHKDRIHMTIGSYIVTTFFGLWATIYGVGFYFTIIIAVL